MRTLFSVRGDALAVSYVQHLVLSESSIDHGGQKGVGFRGRCWPDGDALG